ncbi:MAG: site-2 protease family protein [Clostridia bacterium]|nr:site-2 protease family protein [Clostridia bacterium]
MLSAIRGGISLFEFFFLIGAYAVIVFIVLPIHELAHAWAAHLLGDDTARWQGRLKFNPLRHLDLFGTIMLVLFGVGYAKPVPVNPYNFRNRKRDMALTALAGPLSNIVLAVIAVAIFRVCVFFVTDTALLSYLYLILIDVFASVNIGLAVFNLLPIPPLDGSRIFGFFLPDRWVDVMEQYSRQISMVVMLLLFVGVLDVPLAFLRGLLGGLIGALFGMPGLF